MVTKTIQKKKANKDKCIVGVIFEGDDKHYCPKIKSIVEVV